MKRVIFESGAFVDFTNWATENKKLYNKIVRLIKDIQRSPFTGLGKPEPLRHELKGYWSRRIDIEHRLVYKDLLSKMDTQFLQTTCADQPGRMAFQFRRI